jgi:ComEC/Rec2-related protein
MAIASRASLRLLLSRIRDRLSLDLRSAVGGEEGDLCSALLLGDRSHLDGMTTLQFRRAGASHLLALSGMHLGIVMAVVSLLLLRLRLPYRLRLFLVSLVAVGYLLLTGCALSTLRATLMLLYLQFSHHLGKRGDGLTSLSLFFAVCIAVQPYMLLDVTLWLTSLAVSVPVAIVPALQGQKKQERAKEQKRSVWMKLFSRVWPSLLTGLLCVIVLIIPMWLAFGEMSLLSPVSTLLLTPLVTGLLWLGVIWLLLSPLSGISVAAFWNGLAVQGMQWLAEKLLEASTWFSSLEGSILSLRHEVFSVILPVFGAVLVLLLLVRMRKRYMALILSLCLLLFCGAVTLSLHEGKNQVYGAYVAKGNSELLFLCHEEDAVLCDMTDGSFSAYRLLLEEGLPAGQTELDALLFTHYHSRHVSTLERLTANICLRKLYLPLSMSECGEEKAAEDEGIARKLLEVAQARGIEVVFYEVAKFTPLTDEIALSGMQYAMIKRSAHPLVALSMRVAGELSVGYAGGAFSEGQEMASFVEACMASSRVAILGSHGPIIKQEYMINAWNDSLAVLMVSADGAGQHLGANSQTQQAVSVADCRVVNPDGDGEIEVFSLPVSKKDR